MWMFYLEHWKSIWHMTQVSVSWKSFYEYTVWSIWWTHKCVCDNACVVIFMRACVSLSFVSFSNRLPSLPDVSFPHRWLLNESLPCILLCTCVTVCVCVSKYVFVCVCGYGCVCVSLLQVPSQLFCGASNWRYFSVPGESECVIVFLWGGIHLVCVYARVCMCVSVRCRVADPNTCQPSLKSWNVGSENPLYLRVQSGCFQCCSSHHVLKVFCILLHHALVGFKEHHRNLSNQHGNVMICTTICLSVLHVDRQSAASSVG